MAVAKKREASSPRQSQGQSATSRFPQVAGIGTLLRELIDQLDGDVEKVYREEGLDCKSRFTPVLRHILNHGPAPIRAMSLANGVSHSAISQTVTEMTKAGLVVSEPGVDGRERIVSLTPSGQRLLAKVRRVWDAIGEVETDLATGDVENDLRESLRLTSQALEEKSFKDRILSRIRELD